jgi:hypothetical protein
MEWNKLDNVSATVSKELITSRHKDASFVFAETLISVLQTRRSHSPGGTVLIFTVMTSYQNVWLISQV